MINLLPPKEKTELLLEQKKRLIIILGGIVLISLICLILVFLSIKFYLIGAVESQKIILEQVEKKQKMPDFSFFINIIKNYNELLKNIASFQEKEIYFNKALKTISQIPKPERLYLTNMSLEKDENNNRIKIAADGVSDTRENLLVFEKNLKEAKIKNLYFSPKSWISAENVIFSLTFEVSPNEE